MQKIKSCVEEDITVTIQNWVWDFVQVQWFALNLAPNWCFHFSMHIYDKLVRTNPWHFNGELMFFRGPLNPPSRVRCNFQPPALEKPSGPRSCDSKCHSLLVGSAGAQAVGRTSTRGRCERVSLSLQSNGQSLPLTREAQRCLPHQGHPSLELGWISSAGRLWAYLNSVKCASCSCPWTGHWFSGWRWARRPTWLGGASSLGLSQWFSEDQSLYREHSACNPVQNVKTLKRD